MTYSILSAKGRLSRRDFALTIGTILGGAALAAFAVLFLILPIVFLFVSAFFRDTTTAFWILLIWGILLALCALYAVLPLISIPAAVRRLHDLGRSGYFALPLVLNGFIALGFPILIFLSFIGMAEEITGIRILSGESPFYSYLGTIYAGYFIFCLIMMFLMFAYAGWLFLKKGNPGANRYGDVPAEEPLPAVRTAFLSTKGAIDRDTFVFRTLLALAVSSALFPIAAQFVAYPAAAILMAFDVLPFGADIFVILLPLVVYPLGAFPLVVQRLHDLGRSGLEAVFAFAALIPVVISCIPIAEISSALRLTVLDMQSGGPPELEALLAVGGTNSDNAFITLWIVCGIMSLISIMRLLRK